MGGFFGVVSKQDCVEDIFFGLDYHSHLGTRCGGMVVFDQDKGFQRLALMEEAKTLPLGAVYDYFQLKNNVPVGESYLAEVEQYEKDVLSKR